MGTRVSIVKCPDYQQEHVDQAINQSLKLLDGLEQFVKPGQKVLIKPNILMGSSPETAAATHPSVVAAVIKAVKKLGATALVGDSPGFESTKKAAQGSGILDIINQEAAILADFNKAENVEIKNGLISKRLLIATDILQADVIINIAKLKTHGYSGLTAAVKNLFGCIPGLVKSQFHLKYTNKNDFDLMLLDILQLVKPAINIVDAVVAMEGSGGPATGTPRNMNLIIAGTDAVAVDAICTALTGKQPKDFNLLKLAALHKVGETNQDKIEVVGEKLENVIAQDFKHLEITRDEMVPNWLPKFVLRLARNLLLDKPIVNKAKCTKCGVCFKVCAAKAISGQGYPTFDYSKCIGCFCCQEMCRFSALKIKKSFLGRAMLKIGSMLAR